MFILLIYILILSSITCCLMFIDKQRSIKGMWRISESTFIRLSLLGGSFGTYVGMYIFRHKTKHTKFYIGIPIIMIFNIIILISLSYFFQ